MANLSDQLMALTVLAYLAAMVCYAGEYAFGRRSRIGKAAAPPPARSPAQTFPAPRCRPTTSRCGRIAASGPAASRSG
jgi:hypothetical protein